MQHQTIRARQLQIAYYEFGDRRSGWPCLLGHGFPYSPHAYFEVASLLVEQGAWVVVPYLRGFGPTRFIAADTVRSGEQAALAGDLLALMDALQIESAVLAGYDWGGRAACIVAAIWPERVNALVTGNGYNIQNIAKSLNPIEPVHEAQMWYQYYFHNERGRRGLTNNRASLTKLLWQMWSPKWDFSDSEFARSATAFDNPDFVDVVIHSYRHRYGLVSGDPAFAIIETQLTAQPTIDVPTIAIDGDCDGVLAGPLGFGANKFRGPFEHRIWPNAGHNLPQEQPAPWAQAVIDAREMASLKGNEGQSN